MTALGMATNNQKARIHIGRQALQLSETAYRGLLSGYGVSSSKDLTYRDANHLINTMKKLGWVELHKPRELKEGEEKGYGKHKFKYLKGRDPEFATPRQLRMIEAMWRQVSRLKSDPSLESFVKRITGIDRLEWISQKHVSKLKAALEAMDRQNGIRNDKHAEP